MERFIIYLLCLPAVVTAVDWPQAAGAGNFRTADNAPTEWSVALGKNISWKITLPETGQSTPVIAKGKVFFSTLKPVKADSTLGKDIVAWCCDAASGRILWKREMMEIRMHLARAEASGDDEEVEELERILEEIEEETRELEDEAREQE